MRYLCWLHFCHPVRGWGRERGSGAGKKKESGRRDAIQIQIVRAVFFAFVRGQRAMIRRSPLHFMARPPLQHPHTPTPPVRTHTHTVTVIGCCNTDKPRSWFLCGIPEGTRLPWQQPPHLPLAQIHTQTHTHTSSYYCSQSSHNGCHKRGVSCLYANRECCWSFMSKLSLPLSRFLLFIY